MKALSAIVLACVALGPAGAAAGEGTEEERPRPLTREETVGLFAELARASGSATTFQAEMRRSEKSIFVLSAKPIVSEGSVQARRPGSFRKEIRRPKRSLVTVSETDLWIHFPADREAQHMDLTKLKREGSVVEEYMPWINFNLDEIEKSYTVSVTTAPVPEGLLVRKAPRPRGEEGEAEGKGVEPEGGDARDAKPKAPERAYRITYDPRDASEADFLRLSFLVDGENPWPLQVEKATRQVQATTEFSNIVFGARIPEERFGFKPPRRTRVVELEE